MSAGTDFHDDNSQESQIEDEHFVPEFGLDLDRYLNAGHIGGVHHLIRYLWALEVLKDAPHIHSLLDIACGSGYGSYLLAKEIPRLHVMGADYDQRAIEQARQLYSLPNLAYKVGDVTYWEETLGRDKFDCIVSFDTLEHVSHREIMLQNVVYHLQEDGCMLLSTPCTETINLNPTWEHHHIEYSFASLYDFLRRYFLNIQRPDNLSLPHTEVFDRLEGSSVSYQLQLNPVICQQPIVIANPYQGASMHLQTGGHLATRGLAIWRVFGVRTLIRRAWGYLRRKFLPD